MNSRELALRGTIMFALVCCLTGTGEVQAQTMDQYYAVPPFVSDQVAPNIILVLDNSGSMSGLGCDRNDDGDCIDTQPIWYLRIRPTGQAILIPFAVIPTILAPMRALNLQQSRRPWIRPVVLPNGMGTS